MSDRLALYNEIDPYAADWLRNLIAGGHIAPGVVDTRSIVDLTPEYVARFTQVHFFAGIGVWSYGLRRAGWSDAANVWTGSCPCQPFSAAGKGGGFADERHLWPYMHYLIEQCQPRIVLGEQVASKDGLAWFDLVQSDLEATGYAAAAVDSCSAGFGAPHIRQRLYWMAYAAPQLDDRTGFGGTRRRLEHSNSRTTGFVGDTEREGLEGLGGHGDHRDESGRHDAGAYRGVPASGSISQLADSDRERFGEAREREFQTERAERFERGSDPHLLADALAAERPHGQSGFGFEHDTAGWFEGTAAAAGLRSNCPTGPTNGFWRNPDWLLCRDGKWRPVESGTFPLVDGSAFRVGSGSPFEGQSRVGMLRGYGNAINAEHAVAFCEVVRDELLAS